MLTCAILKQLDESKVLQKGWPSNAVYEPTLVRRLIGHTDGIWDITCKSWHGEQRKPVYTVYNGALFLSILAFFLFFIPSLDIFLSLFSSTEKYQRVSCFCSCYHPPSSPLLLPFLPFPINLLPHFLGTTVVGTASADTTARVWCNGVAVCTYRGQSPPRSFFFGFFLDYSREH